VELVALVQSATDEIGSAKHAAKYERPRRSR
jgi:hypothetical protein